MLRPAEDAQSRLVAVLREAVELLRSHAVQHWPERLESHAERVHSGDSTAVTRLLNDFGGMGSFNDVWIDPRNGHRITVEQMQVVNDRLGSLRSEIYQLSKAL